MTRETRIAMLVGLLFIVVFGLVISELTGNSPPPPALTARDSTSAARQYAPVLHAEPPAPPPGYRDAVAEQTDPLAGRGLALSDACSVVDVELIRRHSTEPSEGIAPPIGRAELELVDHSSLPPPPAPPAGTYTVQAGDNPIRIARKVYGPQHQEEYRRILEANGDKVSDPRRLMPGMVLTVPPLPVAARTPAPAPTPAPSRPELRRTPAEREMVDVRPVPGPDRTAGYREMDLEEMRRSFLPPAPARTPAPAPAPAPSGPARRYYVVRKGDTMAKIAREVLRDGNRSAVTRLYNANKDKLRDPNRLAIGLRLEIPS